MLLLTLRNAQERQLFVFDPKALHHIVIKDQTYFEMPSVSIK
jgi:hypothetical protein